MSPTLFLAAGEPSGDLHGASLARSLRARLPGVRLLGLGGPRMAAEGVELLAPLEELAVMGLVEVLARLPYFLGLRRRVFAALTREKVDLVIPIDYPGFNLRLSHRARAQGIPVLYYIAPQVWAWHASRAADLARDANAVAVILPFEEEFLRRAGAHATFVGHPLLDGVEEDPEARELWFDKHGLDPARPLLALFPGSRKQEVRRHLPAFTRAAGEVVGRRPEVQLAIAAGPGLPAERFERTAIPLVRDARGLLRHATAALVKSGTTTLEAALAGTPFVVAYRMNPLSFAVARRLVRVPHIALTNLVAEERLVPEFVQDAAAPRRLAEALLPLLDADSEARNRMVSGFRRVRTALGGAGASERVAEMAVQLLGAGH